MQSLLGTLLPLKSFLIYSIFLKKNIQFVLCFKHQYTTILNYKVFSNTLFIPFLEHLTVCSSTATELRATETFPEVKHWKERQYVALPSFMYFQICPGKMNTNYINLR